MVNWQRLQQLSLSYPESGATEGALPAGYRHIRREAPIGTGRDDFHRAATDLMNWEVQRRAGVRVQCSTTSAQPGTVVVVGLGPLSGACRVIYVVDERDRAGFAYGTLHGHPESGEEYFGIRFDSSNNTVYAQIIAFSRPGQWWSKAGAWIASAVQRHMTDRYLKSLMQ